LALKIAILLGGTSAERDVSLVSGQEIAKALSERGHKVLAIDCAFGDLIVRDWNKDINEIIHVEHSDYEKRKKELDRNLLKTIDFLVKENVEVVYLALHGGYGENGQIQALLDLIKIPYTGSGSLASGIGMNKHISKMIFKYQDVPTAAWLKINSMENLPWDEIEKLSLPLVIKPNDQGSTVGVSVIKEKKTIKDAISLAFQSSESVIAEKFIPGRELTVAILDQEALPVIEIIPEHGIYDYECKYQKGKSKYIVPAELPEKVSLQVQDYAKKAYSGLGCRHYARVDFRLSDKNEPFCLEVNTLPGMTSTSLVPKAAQAIGISFSELVEKIVYLALES
jgi:D-alanine-D-alanine ligase